MDEGGGKPFEGRIMTTSPIHPHPTQPYGEPRCGIRAVLSLPHDATRRERELHLDILITLGALIIEAVVVAWANPNWICLAYLAPTVLYLEVLREFTSSVYRRDGKLRDGAVHTAQLAMSVNILVSLTVNGLTGTVLPLSASLACMLRWEFDDRAYERRMERMRSLREHGYRLNGEDLDYMRLYDGDGAPLADPYIDLDERNVRTRVRETRMLASVSVSAVACLLELILSAILLPADGVRSALRLLMLIPTVLLAISASGLVRARRDGSGDAMRKAVLFGTLGTISLILILWVLFMAGVCYGISMLCAIALVESFGDFWNRQRARSMLG